MSNSKSHELAIKYLDPKLYGVETRDAGTHYEYRFSIPESSVDSFNKSMESFISYIHGDRNINDPDIIEACEREGIDPNVFSVKD